MRTMALALTVVGGAGLAGANPAMAQYPYSHYHGGYVDRGHDRFHDYLEHRAFHRRLYSREAHRYPMTWRQHQRLHDHLDHQAFHDHLRHRDYHRNRYFGSRVNRHSHFGIGRGGLYYFRH